MPASHLDRSTPTSSAHRVQRGSPSRSGPSQRGVDVFPYTPSAPVADPRRPDESKLREIARRLGVSRQTLEQYLHCRDAGVGRDS